MTTDSRVVTTVRLPSDLAARAKQFAAHREVTLTLLVEAALRNLLHDSEGAEVLMARHGCPKTPAT